MQIERKPVKGEQEKKSDRIWGKVGEGCGQEEDSTLVSEGSKKLRPSTDLVRNIQA